MTHTPGPWKVAELFRDERIIRPGDGGGYALAAAYPQRDKHGRPHYNADANANLIAAAPDLLEACEIVLDELGKGTTSGRGGFSFLENERCQGILRAALAKVRGES